MEQRLIIQSGQVIAQRLFDIAYAINLVEAEALWASRGTSPISRSKLATTPTKALAFETPPLQLSLDAIEIIVEGESFHTGIAVRIYDFGVVSISLRFPMENVDWPAYVRRTLAINAMVNAEIFAPSWRKILDSIKSILAPALIRPNHTHLQEDYLMAVIGRLGEPLTAQALLNQVDVVSLLSGESRNLSDGAKKDLVRSAFSYFEDDLVILTWDRAMIYEPRGESDVIDVLEVANAQLLEMRYYDELLDDELPLMYDRVEEAHRVSNFRAPGHYGDLARKLHTLVAEVTELTERVDNALQVMEDVYLARVYAATLDLFRVPKLTAAVDRKLAIIKDTYTALYDEASARRDVILEITIVVLILLEIVLALVHY